MIKDVYFDTTFVCDQSFYEKYKVSPFNFVIVTAYNPMGRTAPLSRNQHQDLTLKSVLSNHHEKIWRITGQNTDGSHQEPGWAFEADLKEGKRIAKIFRQDAIYQILNGQLLLHDCGSEAYKDLGAFDIRILS